MENSTKTSFLMELFPEAYEFLKDIRIYALAYAGLLALMITLSYFFQWGLVRFFLNIMMGWSVFSILFTGVLIIVLDKEFYVDEETLRSEKHHNDSAYKYSKVWGITLCIAAIIGLYYSNKYRNYYSFQCHKFYIGADYNLYHIEKDCDYIYMNQYGEWEKRRNVDIEELNGKELEYTDYEMCEHCRDFAEEAQLDAASYDFRHL